MNIRMSYRYTQVTSVLVAMTMGCSGTDNGNDVTSVGGSVAASLGGSSATGGANTVSFGSTTYNAAGSSVGGNSVEVVGGTSGRSNETTSVTFGGGAAVGGTTSRGSSANIGGAKSIGGASTTLGGAKSTTGTSNVGGVKSTGGTSTTLGGAKSTGGTSTTLGGAKSTGGTSNVGGTTSSAGTTGVCSPDWGTSPTNVSQWIDESWNAQLKANITSRKAWLIDSVIKGKGEINLCVRWGATTAPTSAVKTNMASAVSKWFNDWFINLFGYGCFPYSTVNVKVTGWAVKPANTSWLTDLDSSIRVYTETDGDGEPKCADACSFFENWNHTFPNCPGGEAYHHDYWLWLDDAIGGGAAAVGGDWGLRMPVSNFVSAMGKSNLVIEHEMGHGFGFQDYYDWTGSTPTGGSLMIVGSTSSQVPTTADSWLLRRTWKETRALRGW